MRLILLSYWSAEARARTRLCFSTKGTGDSYSQLRWFVVLPGAGLGVRTDAGTRHWLVQICLPRLPKLSFPPLLVLLTRLCSSRPQPELEGKMRQGSARWLRVFFQPSWMQVFLETSREGLFRQNFHPGFTDRGVQTSCK